MNKKMMIACIACACALCICVGGFVGIYAGRVREANATERPVVEETEIEETTTEEVAVEEATTEVEETETDETKKDGNTPMETIMNINDGTFGAAAIFYDSDNNVINMVWSIPQWDYASQNEKYAVQALKEAIVKASQEVYDDGNGFDVRCICVDADQVNRVVFECKNGEIVE